MRAGLRFGLQRLVPVALLLVLLPALPAWAAEVLQVRSAGLLQVGDQNRSYGIELACLELASDEQAEATTWLRRDLPRHTRVNLKPQGVDGGILVARVERLDRSSDVASDLVAAGYGTLIQGCRA